MSLDSQRFVISSLVLFLSTEFTIYSICISKYPKKCILCSIRGKSNHAEIVLQCFILYVLQIEYKKGKDYFV